MSLFLSLLIGGGVGAALGYFGKCASGTCPLTANPSRGAVYGVLLGLLFHSASACNDAGPGVESTINVRLVDETQFDAALAQSAQPVVVDFYATWCGPCKRLSPLLDELAGPLTNKLVFLKVDIDQSSRVAQRFNIEAVPTVLFFKNGKPVDKVVGVPSKAKLQERLQALAAAGT